MPALKPVFLFGNGLRYNPGLVEFLCQLEVPVLTTWQACDLVPEISPVFCGRPGVLGMRSSNIIQQKCNWFMSVGARLDNEQTGHNLENFAPHAFKTIVDVDYAELQKFPESWGRFLFDLNHPHDNQYGARELPFVRGNAEWLAECKAIYNHFRPELEGNDDAVAPCAPDCVNPYSFIRELSAACKEGDILVPGSSGQQSCAFMQAFKVKKNQRILLCNTIGAMGMEPMAIGAAIASGKRVIVITGDGGFAQNFQELEVVKRLELPIHYFIFSNGGYGSIKTMQDNRFGLNVGSTPESGLTLPDLERVAGLFDLQYFEIHNNSRLPVMLSTILGRTRATLTSVKSSIDFTPACKVASNMIDGQLVPDAMEDMTPKLDPAELARWMK